MAKIPRIFGLSSAAAGALLALALALGAAAGVGGYTFVYARGASYMTNDPRACANCHIMNEQYDGWTKSSHHAVAVCNDCHAPHDFVGKYWTKARNGFNHSLAFTRGGFHEPIQIKPRNRRVTQNACLHCHEDIVHQMIPGNAEEKAPACVRCHRRRRSAS